MATGNSYFSRSKFRFLPASEGPDHRRASGFADSVFELDESDLFNSPRAAASPEFRRPASKTRISKRISAVDAGDRSLTTASAASLPVNIPDWSKILRNEYIDNRREGFDDDDNDEDGGGGDDFEDGRFRVPPHEFLARTRIASFSVHEGIGRTLKGRDLSTVRDAIWQKTGFED